MEFAASMAAAAAGGNKLICKITSWDEFWTSLDKYVFLATGGKTEQKETKASEETLNDDKDTNLEPESTKDNDSNEKEEHKNVVAQSTKQPLLVHIEEERNKVFSWIKKQEDEFKDKIENDENLDVLAEFVHRFDEKLKCYEKFYKEHGSDLFMIFFKLYRMEHQSCVADFSRKIVDCYRAEDFADSETKLNTVLDNILLKITANADSQEMLVSLVQVMFDGKRHSMVVMKTLWIFSKIFTMVQKDQAKYMQGSLYAIGALLKVEARSYLNSVGKRSLIEEDCKKEEDKNFEVKVRDLSQKEIDLFEKEVHECLCNFVDSLLEIKDIKPGITLNTMKLHSSIIHEDFLDEYDEYNKKDHAGLMKCESANCGLLFLFDILQFFYQFLTETEQKSLKTDRYLLEDVSNYARMYNTIPAYLNHKFNYTVKGSVKLVKHILRAIYEICPNPSHLLELWHMRRHIEVLMSKTTDNEIKEEQNYERTDKFNSIGLLMYIYWGLKRRIDSTVEEEYQHKKFEELEYFESPLPEIVTREFEFEVLFPLISIVLKDKIAYPLLYDVSMEILSYYCRVLNPENLQFPGCKVTSAGNAGENYKSLLQSLFEYIGTHKNNEEKPKVCLELFKKLINLYDPLTMEDILFDMIVEAKHDKEKALLVDYYKDLVMKVGKANPMVSVIDQFKDHIKLLLDHHFDTKNEYIFDISERIISTLNLWRSLYILEKNRSEICENAQKIHERVTCNICDDVSKLIDAVQPGLEAERDKALSNESIQSESKDMMNQTWCTNLMKLDIIREVIARIRSL